MSVIIAGTCRKCGHRYWISLGRPAWYVKWIETKVEPPQVKAWRKLREAKVCLECGLQAWEEFADALSGRQNEAAANRTK